MVQDELGERLINHGKAERDVTQRIYRVLLWSGVSRPACFMNDKVTFWKAGRVIQR